jgi:heme oxygenase
MSDQDPCLSRSEPARSGPATGPAREALIERLRRTTAGWHGAVERLPLMASLMAPTVTLDHYRAYLQRMFQVYGALEPPLLDTLDRGLGPHPGLRPNLRPKLPALRVDLEALDLATPPIPPPPRIEGLSQAIGGLYVLEGASLGARVIARHLRRHLGGGAGDPLGPAAFLGHRDDPGGPSVAHAWRRFGAGLEVLAEGGLVDRDLAVAGACLVFEAVHQILAGPPRSA